MGKKGSRSNLSAAMQINKGIAAQNRPAPLSNAQSRPTTKPTASENTAPSKKPHAPRKANNDAASTIKPKASFSNFHQAKVEEASSAKHAWQQWIVHPPNGGLAVNSVAADHLVKDWDRQQKRKDKDSLENWWED
ncbi:MAG: hypothetical protein LQ337_004064 [Flavoplaca oasis]|nr:MAG: hypothetical protein LQ337_004064 [Flavoplaca oasis]